MARSRRARWVRLWHRRGDPDASLSRVAPRRDNTTDRAHGPGETASMRGSQPLQVRSPSRHSCTRQVSRIPTGSGVSRSSTPNRGQACSDIPVEQEVFFPKGVGVATICWRPARSATGVTLLVSRQGIATRSGRPRRVNIRSAPGSAVGGAFLSPMDRTQFGLRHAPRPSRRILPARS